MVKVSLSDYRSKKFKRWIHTNICVLILEYTYKPLSIYTITYKYNLYKV